MADIELMMQGAIEITTIQNAIAQLDCVEADDIAIDEAEIEVEAVVAESEITDAVGCFGLGLKYSAGAGVAIDLVQAHKWFNIAAMRGHGDAAQLRREVAEQMSDSEIGTAQRAARDWLKAHPQTPAPVADIRIAA